MSSGFFMTMLAVCRKGKCQTIIYSTENQSPLSNTGYMVYDILRLFGRMGLLP